MLETAIHQADSCAIVIGARDEREARERIHYYQPDIAIIDLGLAPSGTEPLIRDVALAVPDLAVITTGFGAEDDDTVITALRAGARGHLDKDLDTTTISQLIHRAATGEAILPRRLAAPILALLHETPNSGWRPLHSQLTTREWQIVDHLADSATTDQIAERLFLSQTTIYSHVKNLMRKLGVHSRPEAVLAAERLRYEEALRRKPLAPYEEAHH